MKKNILLITALIFATIATAQNKAWKIAIHADPNISWLKSDNNNMSPSGSKLNFGYGISIDKMFTDNYAIATGLNIFNTGGVLSYYRSDVATDKINTTIEYDAVSEVTRVYKLKYLEVPLTLRLRTNEIGYITYWVQVGIGLGFNIKARGDEEVDHKQIFVDSDGDNIGDMWEDVSTRVINHTGDDAFENVDINEEVQLFRTSLIAGGGIEYNLSGDVSLVAGVVFNNAFSNVLRSEGVALSKDNPIYNGNNEPQTFDMKAISNALSLQVGILF
jgi:hypothetical protein